MADGDGGQIDRIFNNIENINTNMNKMNLDINQRISDTTIDTNQKISDTREQILTGQAEFKVMLKTHIDSDKDMVTNRRFRITTGIQWGALLIVAIGIIATIIMKV